MTSFQAKIEKKKDDLAYSYGAMAFMKGLAMSASPYERGCALDEDWVDGYLDAMYMRRATESD